MYTFRRASDDIAELARQLGVSNIILGGHDCYTPIRLLAKTLPNFAYMEHLASGELEEHIQSKSELRAFLNGCFGFPRGPNGEVGFTPEHGMQFENLLKLGATALFTSRELDYYAGEYARNGIRGPDNWYRIRDLNFSTEYE
ncbi:uncharacterized protein A1O9_01038 [Exophiala aquamarina CBS 119918]|uniref:Uncharacterized protein n=1 Tax=Exophiala aquamarina CBS 119918 TaxID=1182545 RepID=A0A072PTH4_9EURO|nr:uncharacterized protein A1O9_01038 [Exophiala aquamarina CBS 119918]KEF63062.1 hypothetical protein A1O9_01038 [Exophiala aquamarina CBS 119918]